MKSCSNPKCLQSNPQPLSNFYSRPGVPDGKAPHCKPCKRRQVTSKSPRPFGKGRPDYPGPIKSTVFGSTSDSVVLPIGNRTAS